MCAAAPRSPGGGAVMKVYRSPMEKILEQQENDTVITNQKEPLKTLLRKIRYILSGWIERAAKKAGFHLTHR
jgi:hypothetical protein